MQPEAPLEPDNQQRWKRRYYDTLEELESKERQWRELERLLRHLVTRLTLAADNRSADLNTQLRELRGAIRDGKDILSLRPLIDSVSQTIVQLDKQGRGESTENTPGRWLKSILKTYPVPDPLQRRVKQLNKKLDGLGKDDDPQALVGEFVEVFAALVAERGAQSRDDEAGRGRHKRGLIQQLFGHSPVPDAPHAPANETNMAIASDSELDAKARKLVAPAVGELLLQLALRLPDRVKCRLDIAVMRRISGKAKQRKDLMPLVDSLAHHIQAAYEGHDVHEPVPLDPTSVQALHAALLMLVDEMQTPDDLSERVTQLRELLHGKDAQPDLLVDALHSLADIVGELCARLGAQYQEVEGFLRQLTERLQELDQGLQQSSDLNEARRANDAQLNDAIGAEVEELNTCVQGAQDLQTLKGEVQGRLESIGRHLQVFRHSASGLDEQAQTQIAQLQDRISELEQEGTALKQTLAEHRELALQDALTKLANRQAYDERIRQEIARARRYGVKLAVIVWDVDRFKNINDTYGHTAGDKVLKVLAETLMEHIRETDFLARYGGEEFVMLLPETSLEQAAQAAEKLRQTIANMPFHFRNVPVKITLSAGVSAYAEADNEQSLFERADKALYQAKREGRNRVCVGEMPV